MQNISLFQEKIYNIYIKNLREGLPYKKRKNFDDLNENIKMFLEKLEIFFKKHPHLDIESFFKAPSVIYKDKKYPNLSFFTSRSAIKTYSIYNKVKENQNPENQIEEIKKSLIFIGSFCIKHKVQLDNYLHLMQGVIPIWLDHYRKKQINIYSLMELGNIIEVLDSCEPDLISFIDENLKNNISKYKIRYISSPKLVSVIKESTKRIKDFVKKQLQTQK
jgi:hypothetical protein